MPAVKLIDENLELFRDLINHSNDSIFVVDHNSSRFLYCNDKACNSFGYTREELLATGVIEIGTIFPDISSWQKHVEDVRKKGHVSIEDSPRRKDGSRFQVEVNVRFTRICNRDLMIAVCRDVSGHRQIEERLMEKTRFLEAFFDHTINPVVFLDRDFNFIRVNEAYARATQRSVDEFPGLNHFDLYPSNAKAIFEDVVNTRVPFQAEEMPFVFPDHPEWGVTYWDWSLVPILDNRGHVEFLVFSLTDVTERKQAKDDVQKYQKDLRALVQQVSLIEEKERRRISADLHDSLGQSLAFSKIRLKALRDSASVRDIAAELGDIQELIEQSLKFTRTLTSELSPPILFELGFEKAVEWLCDRIHEKHHIVVELLSDEKLKDVKSEMSILLFKTVRELLINVVKHAGAKKALVSLRKETGDVIRINVEDDGVGFDISGTGHSEDGAKSFGLFNIREQMNYLGGTFDIESGPGQGTRVTLVVPMKKKDNRGQAKWA